MLDAFSEWVGGIIATIVAGGVMLWAKAVNARDREQDRLLAKQGERLAAVESTQSQIPDLLSGIRDELKGLRSDGEARDEKLYERIDAIRRELKEDLKGKQDK